jgi:hypothetical protein
MFLNTIEILTVSGNKVISIDPNYKHGRIGEAILKKIKDDFEDIYNQDRDVATKFILYTLAKYGVTASTTRGGFYSLLPDNVRSHLSVLVKDELDMWMNDGIPAIEKMQILSDIVKRKYKDHYTAEKFPTVIATEQKFTELEDTEMNQLNGEALEALTTVTDVESLEVVTNAYNIPLSSLYDFLN